jgi:hypothetical protein
MVQDECIKQVRAELEVISTSVRNLFTMTCMPNFWFTVYYLPEDSCMQEMACVQLMKSYVPYEESLVVYVGDDKIGYLVFGQDGEHFETLAERRAFDEAASFDMIVYGKMAEIEQEKEIASKKAKRRRGV